MNNIHIIFFFSFFILINIFDKIVLIIESFRKMTKLNIIILGLKPLLKKIQPFHINKIKAVNNTLLKNLIISIPPNFQNEIKLNEIMDKKIGDAIADSSISYVF